MGVLTRIGIALDSDLLERFDGLIAKALGKNRHPFQSINRAEVQARADALFTSIVLGVLQARTR